MVNFYFFSVRAGTLSKWGSVQCPVWTGDSHVPVCRVKEKEAELKESERELHNRFDKLKASVADEKRSVEEQRRSLDEEIAEFQVRALHRDVTGTVCHVRIFEINM